MRSGSVIVWCVLVTRSRRMRVGEIGRGIVDIRIRHLVGDSAHLTQRFVGPAIIAPLLELIDQIDIALLAVFGVVWWCVVFFVVLFVFVGCFVLVFFVLFFWFFVF